jgi:hypothetical protein
MGDGVVEDGGLSHTVDTRKDVHVGTQGPADVILAPKSRYLNLADIICLFLHGLKHFSDRQI